MCAKQLWENDISSKDAGHWFESLLNLLFEHVFFTLSGILESTSKFEGTLNNIRIENTYLVLI